MSELLQNLLNGVVVTPYDATITERLTEVCDNFAEKVTVETIDRYVQAFVYNRPDMDFKQKVEEKYAELYPEEDAVVLPPLFTIVLSQYISLKAITQIMTGRNQATASLKLMNYMLYRKGSLTRLILPNNIKPMFWKMDAYISQQDNIAVDGGYKYLGNILSDPAFLDGHYQEEEVKKEVRKMAKMTELYNRQRIVELHASKKADNPFVRVYNLILDLFEHNKWLFLKHDIVTTLNVVLSDEEKKKSSSIENIVNELVAAEVEVFEEAEEASLLLRYVSKEEQVPMELKTRRLTVMEFGVYLYYEVLLEYIIGEYYGS